MYTCVTTAVFSLPVSSQWLSVQSSRWWYVVMFVWHQVHGYYMACPMLCFDDILNCLVIELIRYTCTLYWQLEKIINLTAILQKENKQRKCEGLLTHWGDRSHWFIHLTNLRNRQRNVWIIIIKTNICRVSSSEYSFLFLPLVQTYFLC